MTTEIFYTYGLPKTGWEKKIAHPFPTHLHLDRDEDFYIPLRSTHEISQEFLRVLIMVTLQHFITKNTYLMRAIISRS